MPMSVLPRFTLHRPHDLDTALGLVSSEDLPYAGGTELLLAMGAGLLAPRSLVDLKRIRPLHDVTATPSRLRIGGCVTHHEACRHPDVARLVRILPQMLRKVGNPRVRAAGTLAGNLCFAEPKSDVATLLIALEASVELVSTRGTRSLPVNEFVAGPYETARLPDELLACIDVPVDAHRQATYLKFQTMERPTVGVAAVRRRVNGSVRTRLVVGAASLVPVVADSTDGAIDVDDLCARLEPLADLTGSADYKRHVAGVLVRRALDQLERPDE
jgi:carbon-monoxide dehydrogenase medium subunit